MQSHPEFAAYYKGRYGNAWWEGDSSGAGSGGDWSASWDGYRALGDDYTAKRQYMLDNPEFAAYYKGKYGEEGETMWWEHALTDSAQAYSAWRGGSYGGGGGGGWSSSSSGDTNRFDSGTPRQMRNLRRYESPRYPMEPAQYQAPRQQLTLQQIRAMIGAQRNYNYLR